MIYSTIQEQPRKTLKRTIYLKLRKINFRIVIHIWRTLRTIRFKNLPLNKSLKLPLFQRVPVHKELILEHNQVLVPASLKRHLKILINHQLCLCMNHRDKEVLILQMEIWNTIRHLIDKVTIPPWLRWSSTTSIQERPWFYWIIFFRFTSR